MAAMAIESESTGVTKPLQPPRMFTRPSESGPALEPIRSGTHVTNLHANWARVARLGVDASTSWSGRLRAKTLSGIDRIRGRTDHELIGELIRAVDAVAARCDEMAARLAQQEAVTSEMAEAFGQELTRLTAAVNHVTGAAAQGIDQPVAGA